MVSLGQIDAIILTAGASKRLGEPKALADIHGESLIEILIRKLKEKKLRIIIYVLSVSLLIINQIMLNLSGKNINYTMLYIFSLILIFILTNFIFFKFIKGETK